jgi:hypothetical protein
MNKQPQHRLNIWNLVEGEKKNRAPRPAPDDPNRLTQVLDILDEFAVLERLYNYGPSISIALHATCVMPNGRSIACRTKRLSAGAVEFGYSSLARDDPQGTCADAPTGTPMRLDVEEVGAFHGVLCAKDMDGFQIAVDDSCKPLLSERITRFAQAQNIAFDDIAASDRVTRIEPNRTGCTFTDHIGILRKGKIVNVSRFDALIKATIIPPVASTVIFSGEPRRPAEVLRRFEIGFAVKFQQPIPADDFSADILFCGA